MAKNKPTKPRFKNRQFGKKNQKRETKINQRAMQLEATLMGLIHKYERGEDVPTVQDTLGNKYISVYVGDNLVRDNTKPFKGYDFNSKTREIYMNLYERMKERGFVLCQRGEYGYGSRGIYAWCLVEHNQNPPEEDAKEVVAEQTENMDADKSMKELAYSTIMGILGKDSKSAGTSDIVDMIDTYISSPDALTIYENPDLMTGEK